MGGKKGKVTRWGQLAARLAANFDFAIVAFAVSPLVKSSLKDFVVSFSSLACTIRCHDLSLSISLAVSFLSRAFSLSCSYAPFPSQADSFSLAHFFPASSSLSLFLHFLPANLSCLFVLCSSTRIAFTLRSVFENISHSSRLLFRCPIYKHDLSAASLSNIFLFKSC